MSARRLLCLQVGEIVGNDGNDHHVEHVVQQERDADDHQNELSLPVGVLHRAAELFSSFTHFRQLQDGRFRQTDRAVRLHDYVKARSPRELQCFRARAVSFRVWLLRTSFPVSGACGRWRATLLSSRVQSWASRSAFTLLWSFFTFTLLLRAVLVLVSFSPLVISCVRLILLCLTNQSLDHTSQKCSYEAYLTPDLLSKHWKHQDSPKRLLLIIPDLHE